MKVVETYMAVMIAVLFFASSGLCQRINSVHFATADSGWAVGQDGLILKTVDGGQNWEDVVPVTTEFLYTVDSFDRNKVFVGASNDRVLLSTNGGNSWEEEVLLFHDHAYYSISIVGDQTGWMLGLYIAGLFDYMSLYRTGDAGETWTFLSDLGTQERLDDICFLDSLTGWAVGYNGDIRMTTDGGINWINQVSGTSAHLRSVFFRDVSNGVACGWNVIIATDDGGTTWDQVFEGEQGMSFVDICYPSSTTGFAVDLFGKIVRNQDTTWQIVMDEPSFRLPSLFFLNPDTGWVVGFDEITQNSLILKTVDSGNSWVDVLTDIPVRREDVPPPSKVFLSQVYPNPFNGSTSFEILLNKQMSIEIEVVDILGGTVAKLANGTYAPGSRIFRWNGLNQVGKNVGSGVYILVLRTRETILTRKILYAK